MSDQNPLLQQFQTPYQVPPFEKVEPEHFMPAIEEALIQGKEEIDQIVADEEPPSFANTIEKLDESGLLLNQIAAVLFNLNAAETNDELQSVTQEASPKLTSFGNEIKQNPALFERIKSVYNSREELPLDTEQRTLLEKTYKGFVRSGANLNAVDKKKFKEISVELSKLSLTFGEHVLEETNDFELVITDESDLAGLPADVKERAAALGKEKGKQPQWIFTLQAPSYVPFIEYADNRALREKMFRAYMSKAGQANDRNNSQLVKDIVRLRAELAELLDYDSYAHFVLEERMAKNASTVGEFLDDLLEKSLPKAKEEVEEIRAFMNELGEDGNDLQRWDWAYYSEKLRKSKFDLDDELTKPYFKLENVIDGVFQTAQKLYDITFRINNEIPKYHDEVTAYEVLSGDEVTAIFMADYFPRKGKRPGAWMTSYRDEKKTSDGKIIPVISIVCNFTPSSESKPSLLKFDEVMTLFHEFGHALHGMLADTRYASLSGTSVFWDFVELPSQIFENWCYEKECLDLFAKHYETGELIPAEYIEKLKESSTYHEAYATVRQISFAKLDMAYHNQKLVEASDFGDVEDFEKKEMDNIDLFPAVEGACMSVQFSHIFAGGYGAGYYSYKWAEVLDADAFSLFQENGVFDRATAQSFKDNILSQGGTNHPMALYEKFRGKKPTPEALLKRAGLVK